MVTTKPYPGNPAGGDKGGGAALYELSAAALTPSPAVVPAASPATALPKFGTIKSLDSSREVGPKSHR